MNSLEMGVVREESGQGAVRFERYFAVPPAELWPFLTERKHLAQWITPDVVFEPFVGGRMLFAWPKGPPMEGTVTEFDEPRRLAYQWREGDVESTVKLELRAEGEGTRLIVDHAGLPLKEAPGFAAGWHAHFDWLVAVLAGQGAAFDQEKRFRELAGTYGYEVPAAEVS